MLFHLILTTVLCLLQGFWESQMELRKQYGPLSG